MISRISCIIAVCGVLVCAAAGAQPAREAKLYIGQVSSQGLEEKVEDDLWTKISGELLSLGVPIASLREEAAGVVEVRAMRFGSQVRITMRFLNKRGIKVLEITAVGSAATFPASVKLRPDLKRGIEALGFSAAKPAVEEAPGIEAAYAAPGDKKIEAEASQPGPGLFKWGWVVAGVGGALLAGGAVTGSLALSENEDLNKVCPSGECEPGHEGQIDRLENLGYATDILLSVGAATVVAGIVLLLFHEDDDISVRPAAGPGFSGAVVEGRF